ncbi:MAG TPA: VOC family protein [Desulfobulbus sp.]|nr:VOC family protein [Desulfobulbus sp.]
MQLTRLTPTLMVQNVSRSIDFYKNVFGFTMRMAVDENKKPFVRDPPSETMLIYAQLERDGVEIMLQQRKSMVEDLPVFSGCDIGASVSFYIVVEDLARLFEQVQGKVDCIRKPETTWYGMREFYIRDPDGYILGFAEMQKTKGIP